MEGKIALFENRGASGKQPAYRGFLEIDGQSHEFALWPARSGNGWSGSYKPKSEAKPQSSHDEAKANAYQPQPLDDTIPF